MKKTLAVSSLLAIYLLFRNSDGTLQGIINAPSAPPVPSAWTAVPINSTATVKTIMGRLASGGNITLVNGVVTETKSVVVMQTQTQSSSPSDLK